MSRHTVAVFREGRTVRVEPARLVVRHDDTITVWSVDAGPLTVFLPPRFTRPLRREGRTTFTVPETEPGCYEYAVHVDSDRVFAEGGSQPKIIILE